MNTFNMRHPSGPECARYAELLPQFRQGTLTHAEEMALRGHLATCGYCQAQLADYDRLDAALYTYIGRFARTAPAADDLVRLAVARVPSTSPTQLNHHQSQASWESRRDHAMFYDPDEPTYEMPTLPRSDRRPPQTQHTRTRSVLATIAALLLIGLAATLFAIFSQTPRGPAHKGAPTATAMIQQPPAPLHLPAGTTLLSLSMASPTDGWAMGMTADRQHVLLLRYHDGQWAIWPGILPQLQLLLNANGLSIDSATDGWITGVGGMLHYTNGQWVAVAVPGIGAVEMVKMISPTDGWARGFIQTPDKQGGNQGLLHFSNGAWSVVALPPPLNMGASFIRFDFSVTPSGECWLVYQNTNTGDTKILRYVGGAFQVTYTLPHVLGETITMRSSQDGWLTATDAGGKAVYHFDGSAWTKVTIPASFKQQLYLDSVVISPTGTAWLFGGSGQTSGAVARYLNGSWETVETPSTIIPRTFRLVADDEGWAIGTAGDRSALYHYQNGSWTQYPG